MSSPPPSLPVPRADWALFLDFDGTLTDIAATPCAVRPAPGLRPALEALVEALGGAVALISGRPLAQLDDFLAPLVLPAAGLHGLERRGADGIVSRHDGPTAALSAASERLQTFCAVTPGVLFEDKGLALALHYRGAPDRKTECRRAVDMAVAAAENGNTLQVLDGKMVFEIKPGGSDKGRAIEAFLAETPFAGRRPVFAGDDRTDEDGFVVVNRLGGITVRVGDGARTQAGCRVESVAELLDWLAAAPAAIAAAGSSRRKRRPKDDE